MNYRIYDKDNRNLEERLKAFYMTAEELWKKSGFYGTYEAWPFGEAPDELASVHKAFDEHTKVVCEEFEVVYQ